MNFPIFTIIRIEMNFHKSPSHALDITQSIVTNSSNTLLYYKDFTTAFITNSMLTTNKSNFLVLSMRENLILEIALSMHIAVTLSLAFPSKWIRYKLKVIIVKTLTVKVLRGLI